MNVFLLHFGGLRITGYKDADGVASGALVLLGRLGEEADTTKSTAAIGVVDIYTQIKDDTAAKPVGADGNLVTIRNSNICRFIFDAEGSAHADVEFVAFDDYDDVALLNALDAGFARRPDQVKDSFGTWLTEQRDILQRERIVNFYDEGPRAMVNFTRLAMLHNGAIRQVADRQDNAAEEICRLQTRIAELERVLPASP